MARRSTAFALACAIVLSSMLLACSAPATPASVNGGEKPTGIVGVWENNSWGDEICFVFCANGKAFMLMPTCNDRDSPMKYEYRLDGTEMVLTQGEEQLFTPTVEFVDDDNIEFDLTSSGAPTALERAEHKIDMCGG